MADFSKTFGHKEISLATWKRTDTQTRSPLFTKEEEETANHYSVHRCLITHSGWFDLLTISWQKKKKSCTQDGRVNGNSAVHNTRKANSQLRNLRII